MITLDQASSARLERAGRDQQAASALQKLPVCTIFQLSADHPCWPIPTPQCGAADTVAAPARVMQCDFHSMILAWGNDSVVTDHRICNFNRRKTWLWADLKYLRSARFLCSCLTPSGVNVPIQTLPVSTPAADAFDAKSGFVRQPRVYGDVSETRTRKVSALNFFRRAYRGRCLLYRHGEPLFPP